MVSFRVARFIIFTSIFILKASADDIPTVFGISGSNVTLRSTYKEISGVFLRVSWYRIMPDGRVELIAYFSSYSTKLGRYSGQIPEGSPEVFLTISKVTFEDSGQYFPAVHEGQKISTGSVSLLTVTDPRRDPNLQLFVSHKPDSMADILCEMRDVGLDWDGPRLEMVDDASLMDSKTGEAVNSHGVFVRSAMMSYSLEKQAVRVACVSQNKDGLTIRRREVTLQRGGRGNTQKNFNREDRMASSTCWPNGEETQKNSDRGVLTLTLSKMSDICIEGVDSEHCENSLDKAIRQPGSELCFEVSAALQVCKLHPKCAHRYYRDEMICPWLLYLSLLCGVLLVVTMATGVVWFYKAK